MKHHFHILLLLAVLLVPFAFTSPVIGEEFIIKGAPTPKPTPTPESALPPTTPVITSLTILGEKEYAGARASLRGKNFLPGKGSASVSFPGKSGNVAISGFRLISDTLLVFDLPTDAASGNVTVTATSERGANATSKPYSFEFHPPEILFVTGDEGIGAGKKIKIWGKYFDGIYYRDNQRSQFAPIMNGKLIGADASTGGNLSVIEITLPAGAFQKEFWVERNCDDNGENCLKSNTITFSESIPPLLTEIQPDYIARTATIYGKNFPEDQSKFSVNFGSGSASVVSYDFRINKAVVRLPCPLEIRSEVSATANGIKSNSLVFLPKDTPQILEIKVVGSRTGENRDIDVAINVPRDIKATSACDSGDQTLTIGSKSFPLTAFGGLYTAQNVLFDDIPSEGDATVVMNGVKSPAIPFSKASFNILPHIYSIEGKLGFRPGVPFVINGRNFSGKYEACGEGNVSINGPKVYFEQKFEKQVGTDEDGNPILQEYCERIPPKVTAGTITAQFAGITPKDGQTVSDTNISVSVGSSTSNVLTVPFGSDAAKVVYSPPEIRLVEYPYGHNAEDEIIVHGSNFGAKPNQNIVSFGSVTAVPKSVNSRGTMMTVIIPEDAGSILTVTRTTPDKQDSEPFIIKVTSYPDEKLSFKLLTNIPKEILAKGSNTFKLAEFSYINSIGDLKINRLRATINWKDADPQSDYSLKKLNIPPFQPFHLILNGANVAGPITPEISGDNLVLQFPPFIMPLTTSGENTFSIESGLMYFTKPGSTFSLRFSPYSEADFLAVDLNRTKGVRPEKGEAMSTSVATVIGKDMMRCLDTVQNEIHCQHYFEQMKPEISASKEDSLNLPQKTTSIQTQKKIQSVIAQQKLKAQEKALLTGRERVLDLIRKKVGAEVAAKIEATLIKKDKENLESFSNKLAEDNSVKLENRKKEIEAESISRKKILAEALLKKVAVAERLLKSRLDSDKDGLSDAEEELLGTDPHSADTDGDGYSDFLEIEFGYSPTDKKTKLIYSDIKSTGGAISAISRLSAFHIISGYEDGTFRPETSASRAQFLSGMIRIFYGSYLDAPVKSVYSDVAVSDWFAPEVSLAKSKRYLPSDADYTFRPYEAITRLEACDFAYRIAGKSPKDSVPAMSYADLDASSAVIAETCISDGLLPSVATSLPMIPAEVAVEDANVVSDDDEPENEGLEEAQPIATPVPEKESFEPGNLLTRGEMAVMIFRALRLR